MLRKLLPVFLVVLVVPVGPLAHAECGNSWAWEDLVGIAADGSYLTRLRTYASMGALDEAGMTTRLIVHAPDGKDRAALVYCRPDHDDPSNDCPGEVPESGLAPMAWHLSGDAPAELLAGNPKPAAVEKQLVKRLALRPAEESRTPVRVSWAFVRAGKAVIHLLGYRQVIYGADNQNITWKVRLLEHPGQADVFLQLEAKHFYGAYGGTCGFAERRLLSIPRTRLAADSIAYIAGACLEQEHYEGDYTKADDGGGIPYGYQCLVDLHDERAIDVLATELAPGDESNLSRTIDNAAEAASRVARMTSDAKLFAMTGAADVKQQAFAFTALRDLVRGAPSQQKQALRKLTVRVGTACLAGATRTRGDALQAALACLDDTKEPLAATDLLAAYGAAAEQAAKDAILAAVQGARIDEAARLCAHAADHGKEAIRAACEALDR